MRKILLFILTLLCISHADAQKKHNLSLLWKQIDSLADNQFWKEISPILTKIEDEAVKKDWYDEQVKAFLYRQKVNIQTSDDSDIKLKVIQEFDLKIKQLKNKTAQAILTIQQARNYNDYFITNYYSINQRTEVQGGTKEDFTFWTSKQFEEKIKSLYKNALIEKDMLLQEPKGKWIKLIESPNPSYLPTLYDIAVYDYIDLLQENQPYQISLSRNKADRNTQKVDSLYQDLVNIHEGKNTDAYLFNKYQLLRRKNTQDSSRVQVLENWIATYKHTALKEIMIVDNINIYKNKANTVAVNQQQHIDILLKKIETYLPLADSVSTKDYLTSIRQNIFKPVITLESKATTTANKEALMKVTHQNTNKIYYKIIRPKNILDQFQSDIRRANDSTLWDNINTFIQHNITVKEGIFEVKDFKDQVGHETTLLLPALEAGTYTIVYASSPLEKGYNAQDCYGYLKLNYSKYAMLQEDQIVLIVDRETGAQQANAFLKFYNLRQDKFDLQVAESTDKNGIFNNKNQNRNLFLRINDEPVFIPFNSYYYPTVKDHEETRYDAKVFTDRSIYRPGQIVYFKTIVYKNYDKTKYATTPDKRIIVGLYDTNNQRVDEKTLVTNEFGSVAGSFVLNTGNITGQYDIRITGDGINQNYNFSVEEYKRPKFEVTFDEFKDKKSLGDSISITGKAKTFSGVAVSNATVAYSINKVENRMRPYDVYDRIINRTLSEIIQVDTIKTDNEGNFKINFKSEIPEEFDSKLRYTQSFHIEASIMDANGETNESTTSLTIGNIPFTLLIDGPEQSDARALDSITITALNLSGQKVPASGKFMLKKRIENPRLIVSPSFYITHDFSYYNSIPENEFLAKFPYEPYGNEYKKEDSYTVVYETEFDLARSNKIKLPNQTDLVGKYKLEAISIVAEDTIRSERFMEITNDNLQSDEKSPLMVAADKPNYQISDLAKITLKTDFDFLQLNMTSSEDEQIDFKVISKTKTSFQIKIPKTNKNSLILNFTGLKNGQLFSKTVVLPVKQDIPALVIETKTFRNKLYPGQKETWELVIKGKKGEQIASELLVNMYDASLDKLKDVTSNDFSFYLNPYSYPSYRGWSYYNNLSRSTAIQNFAEFNFSTALDYDRFKNFGFNINNDDFSRTRRMSSTGSIMIRGALSNKAMGIVPEAKMLADKAITQSADQSDAASPLLEEVVVVAAGGQQQINTNKDENPIQIRKNLQETVFFLPQLRTDKDGHAAFSFDSPESLTRWKFMAIAHSKELAIGTYTDFVETQKDLMIVPNMPRFFREADQITIKAQVNNLSTHDLKTSVTLELFDAMTMTPLTAKIPVKQIIVTAKGSERTSWEITVPKNMEAITYRIVAQGGNFSDGEESTIPVLKNSMLVTETLPIAVREGQSKSFEMKNLQHTSTTAQPYRYTLELTSNPIYHALFALPYVNEYPYESSESIFSKFYLNSFSAHLVNQHPKIKLVFDRWKDQQQLQSKLRINEELKAILIQETPWLQEAINEEETMKNIALLFDQNTLKNTLTTDIAKLAALQSARGGFSWYPGGNESFHISTYILNGINKLHAKGIISEFDLTNTVKPIMTKGIAFLDNEILYHWSRYQQDNKLKPSIDQGIEYLLVRSSSPAVEKNAPLEAAIAYFIKEIDKDKLNYSIATQAKVALILNRYNLKESAALVIKQLQQKSVESVEKGMYWNQNQAGWSWYEAPIETQSQLIQAFDEVSQDKKAIENMKIWLIKNKQVRHWNSTKATVAAVDALINYGENWLDAPEAMTIKVAGKPFDNIQISKQIGSGYIKESWLKKEIKPALGHVEISKTSPGIALGGLYYQYFEQLDQIQSASSTINLQKDLYLKKIVQLKEVLVPITAATPIQLGDIVKVRITIKTDRSLSFIHLKDMRASGFEPTNVTSTYQYKQGFGYYESTKDAATNFFIDYLPQGSYVFEYELRANNAGLFSNGITSIQNLYAPEMSSHSTGIQVRITDQ
ncbi:alpha-2-macroglobulin family protein [Sphingobacterium faecium]|uniref:alpha-2-macroglobulin family protein n=1 Tax=Sphingobacterium faecium TaxID=34087 RepID=UPI003DA64E4B